MEYFYKLMNMLEEEVKEIVQKSQLSAGDIDVADKATHTIKSVECILEKRMQNNSYDGGNGSRYSGARRRDSMGRYMDAGPSFGESHERYMDGGSMEGGYSGRRYSRDEGKSQMIRQFEDLMQEANSQEEREIMRQALNKLKNL